MLLFSSTNYMLRYHSHNLRGPALVPALIPEYKTRNYTRNICLKKVEAQVQVSLLLKYRYLNILLKYSNEEFVFLYFLLLCATLLRWTTKSFRDGVLKYLTSLSLRKDLP